MSEDTTPEGFGIDETVAREVATYLAKVVRELGPSMSPGALAATIERCPDVIGRAVEGILSRAPTHNREGVDPDELEKVAKEHLAEWPGFIDLDAWLLTFDPPTVLKLIALARLNPPAASGGQENQGVMASQGTTIPASADREAGT